MGVSPDCIAAVRQASGDTLSDREARALIESVEEHRAALAAAGTIDRLDERLRTLAADDAGRARLAAALARKHAALNAIVRDRLVTTVEGHMANGLNLKASMLALLEGVTRGVEGGRNSVAATQLAFESRYLGTMLARIVEERPHIERMLQDEALMEAAAREMWEIRDGGNPGVTKNADAKFLADLFSEFAELSRRDLNSLGAVIGKLDGWTPQSHDDYRLMSAGEEKWIADILPKLDLARTFPEVTDLAEQVRILREIYTNIVTGRDQALSAAEKGERTGPANLAKTLGKHRILHFKSADDWLGYNRQFGYGNLFATMVAHQQRAAKLAGQMQVLGPNPGTMLDGLLASLTRRTRDDPDMPPETKRKIIDALRQAQSDPEGGRKGAIGSSFAEISGLTVRPVNVTGAMIGSNIRAVESTAKLGGAVISSMTDPVTLGANLTFQGKSIGSAYADIFSGMLQGRGGGEQRKIAYLIGEGFDGLIGHIISPYAASDTTPGRMSTAMTAFFRWSGLTWWTDALRATGARIMAADMGRQAVRDYATLSVRYRHVLGLHGIDAARWDVIRQAAWRAQNGRRYLTPDRLNDLPEDAFDGLIREQLDAAAGKPRFEAIRDRLRARARLETELAVRRFYADESIQGVLEADASTRRLALQGTRPGTWAGEAMRFIMQFKSFPIAFTKRVVGRALVGGPREGALAERLLRNTGHIGHLLGGLFVAGFMAMTAKDFLRGQTPRDPTKGETWLAALAQSGGAGIYGDFLFGQANRFGNTALETVAGPTLTTASDLVKLMQSARDGEARAGHALNLLVSNTPFLNLWYMRPAVDFLFLNSVRESLSPGYLRRQERSRKRDYGQEYYFPRTAF